MPWTSEQEKEYVFSQVKRLLESFEEKRNKLDTITNKSLISDKDNIGIALNNKMIEMYHFYGNRGLNFFDSSLYPVIYRYLYETFAKGIYYVDLVEGYLSYELPKINSAEDYDKVIEGSESMLTQYKILCNKIYDFKIANDIELAIISDVNTSEKGKIFGHDIYTGHKKELFTKYNEELERLGLDNRISIPEEDVEIIEFSDLTEEQAKAFKALQKEYDEIENDLSTFKI